MVICSSLFLSNINNDRKPAFFPCLLMKERNLIVLIAFMKDRESSNKSYSTINGN
jgi:hypothetical protein